VNVLLVIGTSSLVSSLLFHSIFLLQLNTFPIGTPPASFYVGTVKKNGGHVALFNLGPSQGGNTADFVLYGPCEETVPILLERLGELNDLKNA
jgi:NAD-dependent SIR2 family protein deacetylase